MEQTEMLDIKTISYDPDNPRIKMALEKYGGKLDAERIAFALHSATENGSSSSYTSLKSSIQANKGIVTPITVFRKEDEFICIDGNTRLAIYKELNKNTEEKTWTKIKATVLENAQQKDIEKIRMTAHIVGARQWPAYEKARYLHDLYYHDKVMNYDEIIALCGGKKKDIERQIHAFSDMDEYYRDKVDDTAFHIDRYSGFVELQKPEIKEAIFAAGLVMEDFGEWIRDGKIYHLADVRNLPRVLKNKQATEIFLKGGLNSIKDAIKQLDRDEENNSTKNNATLKTASMYQLIEALSRHINDIPHSDVRALKHKEHDTAEEQIRAMEDLSEQLQNLIKDISD